MALNEVRASADRDLFKNEIRVLTNRMQCLELVLQGDVHKLQAYIKQHTSPGQGDGAADEGRSQKTASATESRNLNELAMAGPCNNFEHLITVDEFMAMAPSFKEAVSADALEAQWEMAKKITCHFQELRAAIRSAREDLGSAVKSVKRDRELKERAATEASKKRRSQQGHQHIEQVQENLTTDYH